MPKVIFKLPDGTTKEVDANVGDNIIELAHENNLPLEAACEGSLACSTCHVIVDDEWFNKLPEASDREEDCLDSAFGLTFTSRLGCQIVITEELDGICITIPKESRNIK